MTHHCALCGRAVGQPAVFIGLLPVGPVCARRAGLTDLARKRVGLVSLATRRTGHVRPVAPQNLSLFEELA